jgi:hypothetical protein
MKTKSTWPKPSRRPPTAAKPAPKPKPEPPQERTVLTARIGELLDENQRLKQELLTARAEANALARALNALERSESKKEIRTMATLPVNLGDIVQYQPPDPNAAPVAALVMTVHKDGKADLKTFTGYCLGMQDVQNAEFSDDVELGKVSKLGAKPKVPKDAPAPRPKIEPKSEAK